MEGISRFSRQRGDGMGFETWGDLDNDGTRDWYQDANRNWSSQTLRLTLEYRFGKMEGISRFSRQRGDGMGFETWGDLDNDGTRDWYQDANRNWSSQTLRLTLEYRFGKMEDRSRFSRQRGEGMEMEEGSGEIF
jgi:hypothetical protein